MNRRDFFRSGVAALALPIAGGNGKAAATEVQLAEPVAASDHGVDEQAIAKIVLECIEKWAS